MKKQYLIGFSLGFILSGIVFTLSIVNYVSDYKQLKNDYEKSKEKESNNIVRINAMLEDKKQYEVKLVESEKSQIDLKNNQQVLQTISSILDQEVKSKVDFLKESLKQV
jgi:hypothetical protein